MATLQEMLKKATGQSSSTPTTKKDLATAVKQITTNSLPSIDKPAQNTVTQQSLVQAKANWDKAKLTSAQAKAKITQPNLLSTIGRGLTSVGQGLLGGGEAVGDAAQYGVANLVGLFNPKAKDAIVKNAQFNVTDTLTKKAVQTYDEKALTPFKSGGIGDTVLQGVGQVGSMVGGTGLLGGLKAGAALTKGQKIGNTVKTLLPSAVQGYGGGVTQGLNQNKDFGTSQLYGLGNAAVQAGSEGLFGGIGGVLGKGALDDVISKAVTSKIKSNVGKKLAEIGVKSFGEGLEENIAGILDPILQRMTIDKNAQGYFTDENGKFTLTKAGQDFIVGAATSALLQSPTALNKTKNKANIQTNVSANPITPINREQASNVPQIKPSEVTTPRQQPQTELQPKVIQKDTKGIMNINPNTTPTLSTYNIKDKGGKEISSFYQNYTKDSQQTLDQSFFKEEDKFYKGITNEDTLKEANNDLNARGEEATLEWFRKPAENTTAQDTAKGFILLKRYQDAGDTQSATEVVRKLIENGRKSGQAVQAYAILSRLTPEGMQMYAQKELSSAYDELLKTKTKEWAEANKDKFVLDDKEVKFIVDKMKEFQTLTNQREKIVALAEINKLITDKIPANIGDSVKSYRRISMLLNLKTIGRNILGNALIAPVNMIGESTAGTLTDKLISKATGVRTTGTTDVKSYRKGFKEGAAEAFDDFRRGINTRDMKGDKFEIGMGKNFNDGKFGRAMNRLDALTNFTLDIGDRPFFKAEFMNSLNNQMKLNNVTEPTADMIEVATKVAEERTWQDSNNYSKAVLSIRKSLNTINIKGFGLGDVIIPFAKTPANLTKAIIDYSPAGVINAITDGVKLRRALENGRFTPVMQKKLVDDVSKAFAGTMLYVLGSALAKAGITSGEADKDKDVAKFKKDILGIQPYSIKIGDKSFTYSWANPLSTAFGVMANAEQRKKDNKADVGLIQDVVNAFSEGGSMLYDQSFLQSVKRLFTSSDPVKGAIETIGTVPASFVPTMIKQLNDFIDPTARNAYEYNNVLGTSIKQVQAKLPFLSLKLPTSVDILGEDIQKYGGANNLLNVLLNPANVAKDKSTETSKELLRLYEATGDKTVIPQVTSSYFTYANTKYELNSTEVNKWQKTTGQEVNSALQKLIKTKTYKDMKDVEKNEVVKDIVEYARTKAKEEYLQSKGVTLETEKSYETIKNLEYNGTNIGVYLTHKYNVSDKKIPTDKQTGMEDGTRKKEVVSYLTNQDLKEEELIELYSNAGYSIDTDILQNANVPIKAYVQLQGNIATLKATDDPESDITGKTISGSKKKQVLKEIAKTKDATTTQKLLLTYLSGYSIQDGDYKGVTEQAARQTVFNYVKKLELTADEKRDILKKAGYKIYDNGKVGW